MKYFKLIAVLLTACLTGSYAGVCALQAAAEEEIDVIVKIDSADVSLTKLKESNYQVPVFVRMEQNVSLNAIEFGVAVDSRCRFELVTNPDFASVYGESLQMQMSGVTSSTADGYTWLSWGSTTDYYRTESSNIAMLLVKLPESATADDSYPIQYLAQSPNNAQKNHVWYHFKSNTDYAKTGSVLYHDGVIRVTAAEEEYIPGDVTGDGKINVLDVISVNRAILNKETLTAAQLKAADIDKDGIPTSSDSLHLMKMALGLE